jgi:hypothetical protein
LIGIGDDEETEIPTTSTPQQQGVGKSPSRRQSLAAFTATSGSSKKTKVNRQKRKVQTKRRLGMKKIEVPDDIANDSGLEKLDKIEKFASKMKMNRTQIKGVIRGICETPELLHLALKQTGELPDDIGELTSQPDVRLTRTGAKTAPDRPWILDKMNSETSPVTPMKNQKGRKRGNEENDLMKLLA